jgi:transcriptional regulator with XRE-family HTH domain
MAQVGYNIRTYRLAKNFTQEYMAEMLGISPVAYGNMERGSAQITIDRLQKIADILDIEPEDLLHEMNPINITAPVSNSLIGNNQHNTIGVSEQTMQLLNRTLEGLARLIELLAGKK